jgi:mono/diheme cytochrome c family protein
MRFSDTVFAASLSLAMILPAYSADTKQETIDRGKYLVEVVAQCQMCHTPRLESGELDTTKWLKGAVLDFQPMKEVKGWHKTSPDLTFGSRLWTRWTEAGILKYLQTGIAPSGRPADPPMPAYKFTAKDAEAVVEYLKTKTDK